MTVCYHLIILTHIYFISNARLKGIILFKWNVSLTANTKSLEIKKKNFSWPLSTATPIMHYAYVLNLRVDNQINV